VPDPSQDKLRVAAGRASGIKKGDEGGGSLISSDGVVPSLIVGVSASDISPCTVKSRSFFLALAHLGSHGKRAVNGCGVVVVRG